MCAGGAWTLDTVWVHVEQRSGLPWWAPLPTVAGRIAGASETGWDRGLKNSVLGGRELLEEVGKVGALGKHVH